MARVALDAMGGDFAPRATVAGALLALAELPQEHSLQLVGQTAVVESELAELLGGELRVRSEPGRGSTFVLRLPLDAPLGPGMVVADV